MKTQKKQKVKATKIDVRKLRDIKDADLMGVIGGGKVTRSSSDDTDGSKYNW